MRCRKHMTDGSSRIGVCATCLRERLIPLLAIQSSPPLIFPRSVSPPPRHPHPLFFSTPHSLPIHTNININNNNTFINHPTKPTKFSLLPKFLRSNSASSTWLSSFFSIKSTATATATSAEISSGGCRRRGRGMSPARVSDCGEEDDTVRGTPPRRRRSGGGGVGSQNVTAFCLSPLVRPSPNRRWDLKPGVSGADGGTVTMPNLGVAAGFCANRSRKMADFGRFQRRH